MLPNPHRHHRLYHDERSAQILRRTIDFFENKGLRGRCQRRPLGLLRNCEFNEILGFYGLAYWYTRSTTTCWTRSST